MQIATRSPNEEEILERRSFLGTLAGASLGVLSEGIFTEFAEAQNPSSADQISLETSQVEVSGNTIFVRRYGKGPAILLVHGFPRTSLTWRFLAPKLAENHTVVCVDLRAYGRSGIPASTDDHFPYSKRAMAKELVEVMDKLGFPTFTLIGHDRGGHVSYRLALDHPKSVERLAVFDVTPIRGHPTMRKMCALQAKAEDSTPLKRDPKCATRNDKIDPNPQLSPSSHTGDRHSPFQVILVCETPYQRVGRQGTQIDRYWKEKPLLVLYPLHIAIDSFTNFERPSHEERSELFQLDGAYQFIFVAEGSSSTISSPLCSASPYFYPDFH